MSEGKNPGEHARRRPDPGDLLWDDPGQYVSLDIRSALGVLAKEQAAGRLAEVLAEAERLSVEDPGLVMRFPAVLLGLFASCTSTKGAATVNVAPCDVAAMAGRLVIAFNWTDASPAGSNCKVTAFDSLTLTDAVTGTAVLWNAIEELQQTKPGAAGTGAWFGKTKSGTPAGAFASGAAVTVTLTFKVKELAYCHTCTPSPVVFTVSTTIK